MRLEDLDHNFKAAQTDDNGFVFHEVRSGAFQVEGFPFLEENGGDFFRLPLSKREQFSKELQYRAAFTAGNCVRFVTDAEQIILRGETLFAEDYECKATMTRRGMNGFDVYVGTGRYKKFHGCVVSAAEGEAVFDGAVTLDNPAHVRKEVTVYLPVYNGVKELWIGVHREARICRPPKRMVEQPIVFYGSSITQGESASRPGNSYVNMVERSLDVPVVNLGFSANAKGERQMAELIAPLPMSLFVMDYDYNSESITHLKQTHFSFYETIRRENPDLPILLLSRPTFRTQEAHKTAEVVEQTYAQAKKNGDEHIYFIDGHSFFPEDLRDECLADPVHPNDMGFYHMAKTIADALRRILQLKEV